MQWKLQTMGGEIPLVHCREVVPISEGTECMLQSVGGKQFVLYGGCPLLRVSVIGGSTLFCYTFPQTLLSAALSEAYSLPLPLLPLPATTSL